MGSEQSRDSLHIQDKDFQQKKRAAHELEIKKRNLFFKVQSCHYPHPLMENQLKRNHSRNQQPFDCKCTMQHSRYPDPYNLCSECSKLPHKFRKNTLLPYKQSKYQPQKPQPITYEYKPSSYKQRDILAPGPQLPTFYNGFSLPTDRYYKQKTSFADLSEPSRVINESVYKEENKQFQQSIYEQNFGKSFPRNSPKQIQLEGFVQNLKF